MVFGADVPVPVGAAAGLGTGPLGLGRSRRGGAARGSHSIGKPLVGNKRGRRGFLEEEKVKECFEAATPAARSGPA